MEVLCSGCHAGRGGMGPVVETEREIEFAHVVFLTDARRRLPHCTPRLESGVDILRFAFLVEYVGIDSEAFEEFLAFLV